jgi:hypothetical protein
LTSRKAAFLPAAGDVAASTIASTSPAGIGRLSFDSGVFEDACSFPSRFESEQGTHPKALIAAAASRLIFDAVRRHSGRPDRRGDGT